MRLTAESLHLSLHLVDHLLSHSHSHSHTGHGSCHIAGGGIAIRQGICHGYLLVSAHITDHALGSHLLCHLLDLLRIADIGNDKARDSDADLLHLHIQILADSLGNVIGIGLQVEHILAFPNDPLHQQLVQHRYHPLLDIINGKLLADTGDLVNQNAVIRDLTLKGAKGSDGHTARQVGSRDIDGTLGPPFHRHFLGIDEKHLCPNAAVEAEFEAL